MIEDLWPGLLIWVCLYCSDYTLTLRCARMYQAGVRDKIAFEGSYELTPYYQKDIDSLRRLSPRFFLALAWTSGALGAVWYLTKVEQQWDGPYSFLLGGFLLLELAVHVRHIRNYSAFRMALLPEGIRGRIEYSRSVALRLSSIDFAAFAGLFFGIWCFVPSPFLLGGVLMCSTTAWKHRQQANSASRAAQQSDEPDKVRSADGP